MRSLMHPVVAGGHAGVPAFTCFGFASPFGRHGRRARVEAVGGSGRGQDWAKPAASQQLRAGASKVAREQRSRARHTCCNTHLSGLGKARRP